MACITGNTVNEVERGNFTVCSCHRGFHGVRCEKEYEWYQPILLTVYIIHTLVICVASTWIFARVKYVCYINKTQMNLANVSLILTSIGILFRLVYLWLPSKSVLGIDQSNAVTYVQIILVHGANTLWILTSLLIMGFWRDIFLKITNKNIKVNTSKTIVIWSVVILFFVCTGMILILFVSTLQAVGLVLVFASLLIGLGLMIYFTVRTKQMSKGLSGKNEKKFRWIHKTFISIIISYSVYAICNVITFILSLSAEPWTYIFTDSLFRISEAFIVIFILFALDYQFRAFRSLFKSREETMDLGTKKTGETKMSDMGKTGSTNNTSVTSGKEDEIKIPKST